MDGDIGKFHHRIEENVWIPLPDGRRLSARIWFPEDAGAAPAILEYLPYRKRGGTDGRDDTTFPVFAAAGYVGIRVDISGTGESDGLLDDEYSEDELSNGMAVIDWIAAQPWSDGNVGMIGISWGGFNGLQIAMRRPVALRAVVSVCATADRYADDIHYMGGCLLTDNHTWAAQMASIMTPPPSSEFRDDWQERWLDRLRNLPHFAPMWLAHQRRDDYWKHGSLCEDWASPTAAILQIGGWADAYRNTAAMVVEQGGSTAKGLMGPWDHKYPHIARVGEPADFQGEVIRWFDHWLRGRQNGADRIPAYRAYVGTFTTDPTLGPRPGYWVSEPALPSPAITPHRLGLVAGGLIDGMGQGDAVLRTTAATAQAGGNFCAGMRLENELPGDQAATDAITLCFDSAPLTEDMELLGQPEVEITLTSDQTVGQIVGRLCEVSPDGGSMLVSWRPFNLTHRKSHEFPEPLPVGQPVRVCFALNQCAHRFTKGNRIRIALSNGYWPLVWPSPDVTTYRLDLTGASLTLPVRHGAADPDAVAPVKPYPHRAVAALAPPAGDVRRETRDDGTEIFETFDDFGKARDAATGNTAHVTVRQVFQMNPALPLSAEVEVHWQKELNIGGRAIVTRTRHVLRGDAVDFITTAAISAAVDGEEVFADAWTDRTPRDHL
ncbi:MAG TPA: CocE/NonD family hydrolase [Paenirhodobacter sp.]